MKGRNRSRMMLIMILQTVETMLIPHILNRSGAMSLLALLFSSSFTWCSISSFMGGEDVLDVSSNFLEGLKKRWCVFAFKLVRCC